MSRVVLIADSSSGALVDVAGNSRESGRYSRFLKRMLSLDGRQLDYSGNGNNTLVVSMGGRQGKEIQLLADKVVVPAQLEVNGKTMDDYVSKSELSRAISGINPNPVTEEDVREALSQLLTNLENLVTQGT